MNFYEFYSNISPSMNLYIYDAAGTPDTISRILAQYEVATHSMTPVYRTYASVYINKRTKFLLYTLHRLNVRPPL